MRIENFDQARRLIGECILTPLSNGCGTTVTQIRQERDKVIITLVESTDPNKCFNGGEYRDMIVFSKKGWKLVTTWENGSCPRCGRLFVEGQQDCPCGANKYDWQDYPSPDIPLKVW